MIAVPIIYPPTVNAAPELIHAQDFPSQTWIINHGLNKHPNVRIIDSGNNVVIGDIQYTSLNSVTLSFSAAFSGKAYID